jgi:hypothetical protein
MFIAKNSSSYLSMLEVSADVGIWLVISAVIAIMGGFVVYFVFLTKDNERKLQGTAKWFYDCLSFKKLLAEIILKIVYLIVAIYITLSSFAFISTSFIGFLVYLIFGNVAARLSFEFMLMLILICRNTSDINSKLSSPKELKKDKKEDKEDK